MGDKSPKQKNKKQQQKKVEAATQKRAKDAKAASNASPGPTTKK